MTTPDEYARHGDGPAITTMRTGILIVGGGPAGLAPWLAASRAGLLPELLAAGLVVAERPERIGAGRIGRYVINSDSSDETFLSCVAGNPVPALATLAAHPVARAIAECRGEAVPLALVGAFLDLVGDALFCLIAEAPRGHVMTGREALWTRRLPDGGWSTRLCCVASGHLTDIVSRTVLIATGGEGKAADLMSGPFAGQSMLPMQDRLMHSDLALTPEGVAEITRRLMPMALPKVVAVSGSTSAVACARVLLEACGLPSTATVTLLHRRTPRLFYPSVAAAFADGYLEFGAQDVCPLSGFVFRFAGLRHDAQALMRTAGGRGDTAPDPRLRLQSMQDVDEACRVLDEADLIVSCLGYRPRGLPVLDAAGQVVPGLFGLGLAAGFRPDPAMGGEPSFRGQVNGLWLWQNDVGLLVARQLLGIVRTAAPSSRAEPIERTLA